MFNFLWSIWAMVGLGYILFGFFVTAFISLTEFGKVMSIMWPITAGFTFGVCGVLFNIGSRDFAKSFQFFGAMCILVLGMGAMFGFVQGGAESVIQDSMRDPSSSPVDAAIKTATNMLRYGTPWAILIMGGGIFFGGVLNLREWLIKRFRKQVQA
jgi:hypothetical protein